MGCKCITCGDPVSQSDPHGDFCWWCLERFEQEWFSFIDRVETYLGRWARVDEIVWGRGQVPQ